MGKSISGVNVQTDYIGALDIGGSKVSAVIAGPDGPLARVLQPTQKTGTVRALPEQTLAMLDQACREAGIEPHMVRTVGIASAGPVVKIDGLIGLSSPNICGARSHAEDLPNDWDVVPLEQVLREHYHHVAIENDCIAALMAERLFGAAQGEADCVYVTWSTGIGFGFCVDGHILRGKNGNAGHAGHMLVSETDDAICGCGNRGDVESLISGRNISKHANKGSAELFYAASMGEESARAITALAARRLGRALYNVVAALDTRTFVIGGSVWNHHHSWLMPLVLEEITAHLPALTTGVVIKTAALGALVTDIGALALVAPEEWLLRWHNTAPWNALVA